jgi:hypothetical protein
MMKTKFATVCAIGALVLGLGTRAASSQEAVSKENAGVTVKQEIKVFLEHYRQTTAGEDEAAIRQLYVSDDRFAWFSDGRIRYASPDDLVKALADVQSSDFVLNTTYSNNRTTPLTKKLASVSMSFQTEAKSAQGPGFSYAGAITLLLERSDTGAWKIVQAHTSTLPRTADTGE